MKIHFKMDCTICEIIQVLGKNKTNAMGSINQPKAQAIVTIKTRYFSMVTQLSNLVVVSIRSSLTSSNGHWFLFFLYFWLPVNKKCLSFISIFPVDVEQYTYML